MQLAVRSGAVAAVELVELSKESGRCGSSVAVEGDGEILVV